MKQEIVRVKQLKYRYGANQHFALNGIDFCMLEGETVIVLGPNGAGKSSFLLSLLGVLEAEGQIDVCGLPLQRANLAAIRRCAALVMQDPMDQLFLPSVWEEVTYGLLRTGCEPAYAEQQARLLLEKVGLAHCASEHPYHMSLGEKRRLALAAALSTQPRLLLLDEPTTHLDPPARRHLIELLRSLNLSMIVVTHDMHVTRQLEARAIFLENGAITAEGTAVDVARRMNWDD